MPTVITMLQLELAINSARHAQPPVEYSLPPDLRALAEIYGRMIHLHAGEADLELVPERVRQAVLRWLPQPELDSLQLGAPACPYRPGDPGLEACESCQ